MIATNETHARAHRDRRRYQREVERLLAQIEEQIHKVRLLKAAGANGQALRAQKDDLRQTRQLLALVTRTSARA
jgi:hypothetical protein